MVIHGITIKLITQTPAGVDEFNAVTYTETAEEVDNVLVAPSSTDDVATSVSLWGKQAHYTLGIPKGDAHVWTDQFVEFFGARWRVIGWPIEGIEANVPTAWHKKVMVERYG